MFSIYSNSNKVVHGQKEFIVDTIDDLSKIPTAKLVPGTTAFVIASSQYYMLNHNQEWVKVYLSGSSSSSDSGDSTPQIVIYDGGVI